MPGNEERKNNGLCHALRVEKKLLAEVLAAFFKLRMNFLQRSEGS